MGHFLAYRLIYPEAHAHTDALSRSGHGWLWLAGPAVGLACAVALSAGLLGGRRYGPGGVSFRVLAGAQVLAYVSIELGERLASGTNVAGLAHELIDHDLWLVLLVGTVLQLLAAAVGSVISRAVAGAAARRPASMAPTLQLVTLVTLRGRLIPVDPRHVHASRAPPLVAPSSHC
jgi:hypothetical protein